MITDYDVFCLYETMFWQCSTEDCEVLFQGNFAKNSTYIWRDLWQFTAKTS